MYFKSPIKNSVQFSLLFVLLAFPQFTHAQSCPSPINPQVVYDPYDGSKWESYAWWNMPSAECPILGFNVEYANYNFEPGTGSEQGSFSTSSTTAVIPLTPSPLFVYIQTVCQPPCGTGGTGGGDGNGGSSWVLATVIIAPPPPPPPPDGSGDCNDASPPVPVGTDCVDLYNPFYDIYYEEYSYLYTINPCTGAEEYMIWNQFISPPTGEITLTGNVTDFGGFGGGPSYDSFGFVVFTGGCEGEMLLCDSTVTVDDTLSFSVPPGEVFIVGTWFNNIEYDFFDALEAVDFNYTLCEPTPDCMYPTDISVSENTDQGVLIEWDDSMGSVWMMEYGPEGFTPGTGTELLIDTESPYLLDNLQSNTVYDFYLYNECDAHGSNSLIIGPTSFETHPSITLINPIANGQLYCCDEIVLPETAEVEAFCDSVYFSHVDSIVGDSCPYTIYRTIAVHDTCGNSIQTAFHYGILDNQIPCGCEAETIIPEDSDEIRVALHGDWAVFANGAIDVIHHFQDGEWIPHDTIAVNSSSPKSLAIYDDVIVKTNRVYRLNGNDWSLETTLEPSIPGDNTTPYIVAVHENTIAYELNDMIFIFEYAGGTWSEVANFPHNASSLDMSGNTLLAGGEFGDHIGRIYRKTDGNWTMEQELSNFHPDNNGNGIGYDVAIDGPYAAIGYFYGGGLFTFKYNGNEWEEDEFLTNPYQVNPGGGYATSFGHAVDIEGNLMVVGDYFNAVNGNFSGSVAVFERSCDQWLPQRNIVPSNGEEDQRFGGCLDLQGSRLLVGVNNQYWLGGITYGGIGHFWFYECLESNPTFSFSVDDDLNVSCTSDIPPAEASYSLGNAWCTSTEVSIETDTIGTGCELTITRLFTATDSLGNTASATQQITLSDTEAPIVVSEPEDVSITCSEDAGVDAPVFIDNCTDSVQVVFTSDTLTDGCNTYIDQAWTATDDCDNSTMVSRTVTITDGPPEIISVPEELNLACGDSWEMGEPVFTDECTAELEITYTTDTVSLSCPIIIQHQWTATDGCGNSTIASRNITLTDSIAPEVISAPDNLSVECSEAGWEPLPDPVFEDDCSGITAIDLTTDTTTSECPTVILYNWTAQDACGNETSIERTLTITDNTPPQVVSELEELNLLCTDDVPNEMPEFIDDCGSEVNIEMYVDTLINDGCTLLMDYTWEATDNCGNTSSTQRTITVTDEEPPVLNCPEDMIVFVSSEASTYTVPNIIVDASFSDNCAELDISQSPAPGTNVNTGSHEIVISATDGCYEVECTVGLTVQFGTGIEQEDETLVRIFPNPTNGLLNVQLPTAVNGNIELFDITGKLVMSKPITGQNVALNVSHLSAGMYALQINTAEYRVVEKVIVE